MQSHHALCQTDPIKLQLLRLWEESLYQEFIAARSHGPNGEAREVRQRLIIIEEMSLEFVTRKAESGRLRPA